MERVHMDYGIVISVAIAMFVLWLRIARQRSFSQLAIARSGERRILVGSHIRRVPTGDRTPGAT